MDEVKYRKNSSEVTKTIKPSAYAPTDAGECMAVHVFNFNIDHRYIKSFITTRDKVPNHDGNIEILDIEELPLGKLCVQVKKLGDQDIKNPIFYLPENLFGFAERSILPVIFIAVDCKNNIAYYHIIDNKTIRKYKKTGYKKVVFNKKKVIDGKNTLYLDEWRNLIKLTKNKIEIYDHLKDLIYDVRSILKLGEIFYDRGDHFKARKFFKYATKITNDKMVVFNYFCRQNKLKSLMELAIKEYNKKNWIKAEYYIKQYLLGDNEYYAPWLLLSKIFLVQKKPHQTELCLTKASKFSCIDEDIWFKLIDLYLMTNNFIEAIKCFNRFLKLENKEEYYDYRIQVKGIPRDKLRGIGNLIKKFKKNYWLDAGHYWGTDMRAFPYYERVIALDPLNIDALLNSAIVLEDFGNFDYADNLTRKVLELEIDDGYREIANVLLTKLTNIMDSKVEKSSAEN